MTSISKNVYIAKLNDIVYKYNNAYHRTIQMKTIHVKISACIDFDKNLKFKVVDHVGILNMKIFSQRFTLQRLLTQTK